MSSLTVFFAVIIAICTALTIMLNRIIGRLGNVEKSLKELEAQPEELSARQTYDQAVARYNESIIRFPGVLVAGVFGFTAIPVEQMDDA